ncbi:MAG: hypothetical protein HY661_12790 [Betaproteobacteria bacterium]|nr:hypothetical protein [Betaproteobacteria bacterium]
MEKSFPLVVPRRAVQLSPERPRESHPLARWRGIGAYVLLAEPGAGKTEAFKREARKTGGEYTSARDFITLRSRSFKPDAPIFIDGLDEIRAGSESHRAPLDNVRRRLDELGRPKFRLSCREADWRSAVDNESLTAVASKGELAVLHLEELDDADIVAILRSLGVEDPEGFLVESERHRIRSLLGNPLLLGLIVNAVAKREGRWPDNRTDIYTMACEQLAIEYNEEHRAERRRNQPSIDRILDDAGLMCALHLLAGIPGFSVELVSEGDLARLVDDLPDVLGISDPRATLHSKIFVMDCGQRIPRHRTIAEFLAAAVIAKRIKNGLPVGRVLALMSGADGGIVDPLRGLNAWLATRCEQVRPALIERDPLGVVLYGDLRLFTTEEKSRVLRALHREAQRFAWFRKGHWEDHPFGALGTEDMSDTFQELLAKSDRSLAHQSLLGCVLDAIEYGELMPKLAPDLRAIIRDASFSSDIRLAALDAWMVQRTPDMAVARTMLDDIEAGGIVDPDDQLAGRLLDRLYPEIVTPSEIAGYFRAPKTESFYGLYQHFWQHRLVDRTPQKDLRNLMDAWASAPIMVDGRQFGFFLDSVATKLLVAALEEHGDDIPIETLHRWLGIAIDEYGFSRLPEDDVRLARDWLSARPSKLKALVAYGWTQVRTDGAGRRRLWESEERTLGAARPADWYEWLLDQASATDDEALARDCFDSAAYAAINPRPEFTLSMEAVEKWVELNQERWPQACEWLKSAWSLPLDHFRSEELKRRRSYDAERETARRERRRNFLPHLASIAGGTAPPGLMHQIALAYDRRYSDIRGETPEERVQDLLGGTIEEAKSAIGGLEATPARMDLPDVDDILKTDLGGRSHFIRPACLLGASLVFERDPKLILSWPDDLVRKLAAFWLTDGVGDQPEWFSALAETRPTIIAPVLEKYAMQTIRRRSVTNVTGLWQLAREDRFADLARLVVPPILRAFPVRANEKQLRILNGELLPATSRLSSEQVTALLAERTALKSLDTGQRIAYLVAGLRIDGEGYSSKLVEFVGTSESRAAHLGRAIELQGKRTKNAIPLPILATSLLIELIGPHASPEYPTGVHSVGDADHRREWTHHLINQLASAASAEAAEEIARLAGLRKLNRWKLALDGAAFDQSRAMRDATFKQPSVDDVANVLANRAPANSRDLAALFLDHLRDVGARLHGDDTNGLLLFRRDDRETPKTENECRDILLDRMRNRLVNVGVKLEKEGQAAQDTRADMRAEYFQPDRRFTVPIEIKKEDNRELWSAWRTQLRTYTLDPASEGVGIYLVLWFGLNPRATPAGERPTTPQSLIELLSGMVPEEDRFQTNVAVLDLSMAMESSRRHRPSATTAG